MLAGDMVREAPWGRFLCGRLWAACTVSGARAPVDESAIVRRAQQFAVAFALAKCCFHLARWLTCGARTARLGSPLLSLALNQVRGASRWRDEAAQRAAAFLPVIGRPPKKSAQHGAPRPGAPRPGAAAAARLCGGRGANRQRNPPGLEGCDAALESWRPRAVRGRGRGLWMGLREAARSTPRNAVHARANCAAQL